MTQPAGSITDVPGIRVGQVQRIGAGWLTGVSVVLPPPGTVGSVDVRGGGPGTHETDALDPSTLVPTVDAVVLTGGSAYGLVAAAGVQAWCEEHGRGFAVPGGVVPIVPAAAVFDLGRGGDFAARPDVAMGYRAAAAAGASELHAAVARGNVGAGTGAALGGGRFKGGTGTASLRLSGANSSVAVGALAVVNAAGLPWHAPCGHAPCGHGMDPRASDPQDLDRQGFPTQGLDIEGLDIEGLNTTLVVVATNAALTVAQAKRTATAAHAGMARALSPVHTLADGDAIFTLATCAVELHSGTAPAVRAMTELQAIAAEVVRLAIVDGINQAQSIRTAGATLAAWSGEPVEGTDARI